MNEPDERAIYSITRPHPRLLSLYALRCALTGPGFLVLFLPCFFKYETLRYRFDDEGITMAWGFLWRREIFLTYARIQDIHLSRGLLERWLGLATINIQTASGSSSAEMALVGLTEFEAVRDFLYTRMRGARFGEGDGAPAAPQDAAGPPAEQDAVVLLTEIRDEIRALRARLEETRP